MLKIAVFDGGQGGEVVADFLASELKMVEVVRIIDWLGTPYEQKTASEIRLLLLQHLAPYVGKVDLIVLGGYLTSAFLNFLRNVFPSQRFVGVSIKYSSIPQTEYSTMQLVVLMNEMLVQMGLWREMQQRLPCITLIMPDCSGWEELVDLGEMSSGTLREELADYFWLPQTPNHRGRPSSLSPQRGELSLATCGLNIAQQRIFEFLAMAAESRQELALLERRVEARCEERKEGKVGDVGEEIAGERIRNEGVSDESTVHGGVMDECIGNECIGNGCIENKCIENGRVEDGDAGVEEDANRGVIGEDGAEVNIVNVDVAGANVVGVGAANEKITSEKVANIGIMGNSNTHGERALYRADAVVVLNTHFWNMEKELAEVFGPAVPIIDFRERLLHDVCLALGLRGVDGRLGRKS